MTQFLALIASAFLASSVWASGSEFNQFQQQQQAMGFVQDISCPAIQFSHGLNLVDDGTNTNYEIWFSPLNEDWENIDFVDVHFILNPSNDDFLPQHNWQMDFDSSLGVYWTQDKMGEGLLALRPTDTLHMFFTYSYMGVQCDSEWLSTTIPGIAEPAAMIVPVQQQMQQQSQFIAQQAQQAVVQQQAVIQEQQAVQQQQAQAMEEPKTAEMEIPKTAELEEPKTAEAVAEPDVIEQMDSEWSAVGSNSAPPGSSGYSKGYSKQGKGYSKQSYGKDKGYSKQSYGKDKSYQKQSYGKDKSYGGHSKQSYGKQSYQKDKGYSKQSKQQSYAPQQSYQQQSYQQQSYPQQSY